MSEDGWWIQNWASHLDLLHFGVRLWGNQATLWEEVTGLQAQAVSTGHATWESTTQDLGMGVSGRATEHAALGPFKTTVHALDGGGKVLGLLMGMWNLD